MSLLFGKMKNMFLDRPNIAVQKHLSCHYVHSKIKLSCCVFKSVLIYKTQTSNFAYSFVRVLNLVSNITGRKRLTVLECVVLRKALGSEREDVKRDWRKFRDQELHCL